MVPLGLCGSALARVRVSRIKARAVPEFRRVGRAAGGAARRPVRITSRMCVEALRGPARRMAVCTLTFASATAEPEGADAAGWSRVATLRVASCRCDAGR